MGGPGLARVISYLGPLALAVVYFVTARAGLTLATVGHSVSLVWPPSGLAIAALQLGGMRLWPGVTLAALAVNATTPGVPLATAAAMAAGNTAEALLATWLLRRSHFDPAIRRVPDVFRLVGLAGLLSTGVAAVIGTLSLRVGGVISTAEVPLALRVWWIGDLMGVLIVAPLLWTARGLSSRPNPWRVLEAALLAAGLLTLTSAVFRLPQSLIGQGYLRSYVVFPALLWAALRFEARGAAWANFAVSAVAVWCTMHDTGPFALVSANEGLLNLQIFMAIAVLTSLALGAATAERSDAIRAREDFISIASHELRTPLTPLTLQIDRLGRRLAAGKDSRDDLSAIQLSLQRQADRLTGLVDILLDITRLRTGRMTLDPQRVDLAALARDTVDGLGEELARAHCTVSVEAPHPVHGSWDRTRLQQAVTNLLTNAAKYASGAPVAVSVTREGAEARLVVADRGPGIPFDEQARLFRRFARLPSTRPRAGGLGLGLYITREILEAHGGSIRLESRPGAGASFICTLPVPGRAAAEPVGVT
jgi:signal transduction histidine kinase